MEERTILVTETDENQWGVSFLGSFGASADEKDVFVRMQTKEDAVRYARICEQRTRSITRILE